MKRKLSSCHEHYTVLVSWVKPTVSCRRKLDVRSMKDQILAMDEKNFAQILDNATVEKDGDWTVLQGERTMTLHVAHEGVGLNLTKICRVRVDGALLFAEGINGELSVTELKNVIAVAVEAENKAARKAGFR